FSLSFLLLSSCQEDIISDSASVEDDWEVRLNKDGKYLEFESRKTFEAYLVKYTNASINEIQDFEKQLSFTSMTSFYKEAVDSEIKHITDLEEQYDQGKIALKELLSRAKLHSPFVERNKEKLIIHDDRSISMNIFHPGIANLVNDRGFVKIHNTLYQYTNDYVKSLEEGDIRDLNNVSKTSTTASDSEIIVSKVKHRYISADNEHNSINAWNANRYCEETTDGGSDCQHRIRHWIDMVSYDLYNTSMIITPPFPETVTKATRTVLSSKVYSYRKGSSGWYIGIYGNGVCTSDGYFRYHEAAKQITPSPLDSYLGVGATSGYNFWNNSTQAGDPTLNYTIYDGPGIFIDDIQANSRAPLGCDPLSAFHSSCSISWG
ncbi:MAG: hypothetical protein AAF632_15600, partial [Bacteroidota bacterium]